MENKTEDIYVGGKNLISPHASVSPLAILGKGNIIEPFVIIGDNVVIGDNNKISSHVVIGSPGGIYEQKEKPKGKIYIGNNNQIREFAIVKYPARKDKTVIGNDCYIMDYVNISHDTIIGNHVIIATGTRIGGVCEIGDYANFGMNAIVRQRMNIGEGVMVGMGAIITKNILPFSKVKGVPARISGFNVVGCKKRGFDAIVIKQAEESFQTIMNVKNSKSSNPVIKKIESFKKVNDSYLIHAIWDC